MSEAAGGPSERSPANKRGATPRPPTPTRLWNRALAYLARFAAPAAHLQRVLLRRALRDAGLLDLDQAQVKRDVAEIVARAVRLGLVDDAAYAAGKARRLTERGRPPRAVAQVLAAKGVRADTIDDAPDGLDRDFGDPALKAALVVAKRRRLGPWRVSAERREARRHDLAVLARAGFDYRTALRVIDAATPDQPDVSDSPDGMAP